MKFNLEEFDLEKHYRLLNDKRNSFPYWYPKVKDIAPTPSSYWIEVDFDFDWLGKGVPKHVTNKIKKLALKLNPEKPYPFFMRTDTNSGKHDYKNTCLVTSERKIASNLRNLTEDTLMKDLTIRAIVVREFIELDWKFKAFWGELPIAPEVRVMIRNNKVERWFFYWPEDAIRRPSKPNWRKLLREMREIAVKEQSEFLSVARQVAERFVGYWSVDFARTRKGEWMLVDMALGEVSWRPEISASNSTNTDRNDDSNSIFDFLTLSLKGD